MRFICLLLLISLSSCVTKDRPENLIEAQKVTSSKEPLPLLWTIERDGFPKSFLFGTIHLGVSFNELPELISNSLKQSQQLILEVDTINIDPNELRKSTRLPKHQKLQDLIGDKYWQILLKKLPKHDPSQLSQLNPFAIFSLLQSQPHQGGESMDRTIQSMGKKQNKSTICLESVKFQLKTLNKIFTIATLKKSLKNNFDFTQSTENLRRLYLEGEEEKIQEFIRTPQPGQLQMSAEQIKLLLDDRNVTWASILEPLLSRSPSFVAVGSGHLGGDKGLLKLLEKRGFIISRTQNDQDKGNSNEP